MRCLVESRFRFSRENQQMRRTAGSRFTQFGCFLEDEMRVRSAHAGRHHSCSSGTVAGPFPQLRVYEKRGARKIDFGIGLAEVEARGKFAVLECEDRFDQASDACGRIKMSDIGFYRANGAIP